MPELSIIIPVYNEEHGIKIITERLTRVLELTTKDYEIIFVNDGSKDNSKQEILNLRKNDTRIKLVSF